MGPPKGLIARTTAAGRGGGAHTGGVAGVPDASGFVPALARAPPPRVEAGQVMCAQGAVILGGRPEQQAGHGRSIAA